MSFHRYMRRTPARCTSNKWNPAYVHVLLSSILDANLPSSTCGRIGHEEAQMRVVPTFWEAQEASDPGRHTKLTTKYESETKHIPQKVEKAGGRTRWFHTHFEHVVNHRVDPVLLAYIGGTYCREDRGGMNGASSSIHQPPSEARKTIPSFQSKFVEYLLS